MSKNRKKNGRRKPGPLPASENSPLAHAGTSLSPGPCEERFLLEKLLGTGGVCEVYAALDLRRVEYGDATPTVAVKRLRPALADNAQARLTLAQEFCILRHLAHPGVVRTFDLHKEPFGICFSMELLEGHTLQEELLGRPAGLGEAVSARGRILFDTLYFLHIHGIVHGDIKPSNLFPIPERRMALIDFNVATATARAGAACSPVTRGLRDSLHLPSFSLRYASPERLRGGAPSAADDVFAACCTLYEAATGLHPFGRLTSLEAAEQGLRPERPAGLTSQQWLPVRKGLSFERSSRPDASALFHDYSRESLVDGLKRTFRNLVG